MLYEALRQNRRRTAALFVVFVALVAATGWALGTLFGDVRAGLAGALLFAAVYLPLTYFTASAQVLALTGAREVTEAEAPELHHVVEEVALAARLPKPKVYVVDDEAPNAFAVGFAPDRGAVAFTTGLLRIMDREALEGVAAHEIAHLHNGDSRLMTLAVALVGIIVLLADIGGRLLWFGAGERERRRRSDRGGPEALLLLLALLVLFLAPLAAQLTRFALSRNREFYADAQAVNFTRNPRGLIKALTRLKEAPAKVARATEATADLYFVNPFGDVERWFRTHPPIEERIRRLEAM
ncbi:MAG: Heat shock protein HtpX [Hydrogenibacillus schlegelii]|uniref:Protease HtpX homolog n=1 Tax=Hydrogenibacillus schlegelii TaxID=1484 RepID=A0A2T5GE42_HYDSH|nr:M48 family metalloprotease [Hydrogenibacillus schlegelii]PTQ54452.1 MAG: Heat shock protein HtpX [Hydrogenibacillus schlegelii]